MKMFLTTSVLAIGLSLVSAERADALSLRLTDNDLGVTLLIDDNDANDANPTAGVVSYTGTLSANWLIGGVTLFGEPLTGGASFRAIDLSAAVNGIGKLTIAGDDDGLSHGADNATYGWSHAVGGTTEGMVSFRSRLDSYLAFPPAGAGDIFLTTLSSGPFSGAPGQPTAFSDTQTGTWSAFAGNPFDLTVFATIEHAQMGLTSFDVETVAAVPVPASLPLAAAAFGALALLRRSRRGA